MVVCGSSSLIIEPLGVYCAYIVSVSGDNLCLKIIHKLILFNLVGFINASSISSSRVLSSSEPCSEHQGEYSILFFFDT